jgi:hypothetical protein
MAEHQERWAQQISEWPPVRFRDGKAECIIDQTLPPRPPPIGCYGSTGAACVDSPLAER